MQCCPLRLLKVFQIQTNYKYFSLVCYVACEYVCVIADQCVHEHITFILGELPCFVNRCLVHGISIVT